jgi:hypothetical protein
LREAENLERAAGLMTYIRSYRVRGHLLAHLDPLVYEPKDWPELDTATYGLTIWDLERTFYSDGVTQKPLATLREIQETLHLTYCRHVGVEYMHIPDPRCGGGSAWSRIATKRNCRVPACCAYSTSWWRPRRSNAFCTPGSSATSASRSKAATR